MYLKRNKVSRKFKIENIRAAVLNASDATGIVLHIPSDYDHWFIMDNKDDFLQTLQLRYANIDKANTLKIFKVKDSIKKYITTLKDRKYGIIRLPPNEYRAKDIEIH